MCVSQLGHAPDVAGKETRGLRAVLALAHGEMIELLGGPTGGVIYLVAVADRAGEDPEVAHIAHVGLGDGFEYLSDERTLVFRMDFHGPIALGALEGVHFFHLVRIGHELHDCGEHSLHTHVELTRNAEEWE